MNKKPFLNVINKMLKRLKLYALFYGMLGLLLIACGQKGPLYLDKTVDNSIVSLQPETQSRLNEPLLVYRALPVIYGRKLSFYNRAGDWRSMLKSNKTYPYYLLLEQIDHPLSAQQETPKSTPKTTLSSENQRLVKAKFSVFAGHFFKAELAVASSQIKPANYLQYTLAGNDYNDIPAFIIAVSNALEKRRQILHDIPKKPSAFLAVERSIIRLYIETTTMAD